MVPVAVVGLLEVHAEHDRRVRVGRGRRDDDLLRALFEVLGGVGAASEVARGLDHHVDALLAPRERRGVGLRKHLQGPPVDLDRAFERLDAPGIGAEDRVVLEQVCERLRADEVVDGHPFDVLGIRARMCRPEDVAADAAESVDAYSNRHLLPPEN